MNKHATAPALALALVFAYSLIAVAAPPAHAESDHEPGELIWAVTSSAGRSLYQLAVDANGVYVVGNATGGGGLIEKRDPADGSLIWSEHIDVGELMQNTIDDNALYLATAPWGVEKRSLDDGSVIWSQQGAGGKPYGIVVDEQAVYIAGRNGRSWRVEKRDIDDGSVIWRQDTVGGVALAVAVHDDGLYLGGYDTEPGNQRWRMEKRDKSDGSLVWEITHNPSDSDDKVYGLAVDDTGVYAAGQDSAPGSGQWRIEKRSRDDGSLIWEHTANYSDRLDKAHGLTADATGVYIPGYEDSSLWRIEKRSLDDGSLIWARQSVRGGRLWYAVDFDDTAVYVGGHADREWRIEKRAK